MQAHSTLLNTRFLSFPTIVLHFLPKPEFRASLESRDCKRRAHAPQLSIRAGQQGAILYSNPNEVVNMLTQDHLKTQCLNREINIIKLFRKLENITTKQSMYIGKLSIAKQVMTSTGRTMTHPGSCVRCILHFHLGGAADR